MRPFLRWAGGKRWLAESLKIEGYRGRYIEPFVGGGAVFFEWLPPRSELSDLNPYLINCYKFMRDSYKELYDLVMGHFRRHSSEWYYSVRSGLMSDGIVAAADFLYLNRSCFNGLFRVNLRGNFNVPIGSKLFAINDLEEFRAWSEALSGANLYLRDFEQAVNSAIEGDFLFCDPPYTVNHNRNGFVEYNEKIFSWEDQVRLRDALQRASLRGVDFLLTNADHSTVRDLYHDFDLRSIERCSEMAGSVRHRGKTSELLISPSR